MIILLCYFISILYFEHLNNTSYKIDKYRDFITDASTKTIHQSNLHHLQCYIQTYIIVTVWLYFRKLI